MKLFRFRPIANPDDYCRAAEILKTGKFWCSRFFELKDPMEGVFSTDTKEKIHKAYETKSRYRICSFSHEKAFGCPTMWGYYANGFKGIAIEIEVGKQDVYKIKYKKDISKLEDSSIEEILTNKLNCWEHEKEYRFLKIFDISNNEGILHKIGEITKVYFGDPFGNAANKDEILRDSRNLQEYEEYKKYLTGIAKSKNIKVKNVKINDNGFVE